LAERRTADPSAPRDDKGEGGDFYGEPLDRMDRYNRSNSF
jgi:hypothetical protein